MTEVDIDSYGASMSSVVLEECDGTLTGLRVADSGERGLSIQLSQVAIEVGVGVIMENPGFADPTTGNYHLTQDSPCIDFANPSAAQDVDIDGDTRPQGDQRDIGADEYVYLGS